MFCDRWCENVGLGSGIFWDLGLYFIDQVLQFFGEFEKVLVNILVLCENGQLDDMFDIMFYYSDKVVKFGSLVFQVGVILCYDL